MLKPGLLKAETIALLHTPLRLESGTSTEYALGWKVDRVQLAGAPVRMLARLRLRPTSMWLRLTSYSVSFARTPCGRDSRRPLENLPQT
jgi:hypothetical protein